MRWWSRARRRPPQPLAAVDENVLVISDIHLGEDITVSGPGQLSEYIRALNRELALFLQYHRQLPLAGRRWHLVINGDMFDFVKVSLGSLADIHGAPVAAADGSVPNTPENVVWKLRRILEIHRPLFRELALLLADGHRITIIEGNHDAEFYFTEVRETLRQELTHLANRAVAQGYVTRQAAATVAQRLVFRNWFEAMPGRLHIEHGHQYDEYCSFEYNLAPHDDHAVGTLATPLSHRPVPYFAELLGDFSTHGVSGWSFGRMLRFLGGLGPRAVLTVGRVYFTVLVALVRRAGKKRQNELQQHAAQHAAQLQALSLETPYGYDTLAALDRLKAPPAEYSLFKMIHVFYLDRFLTAGAGLLGSACAYGLFGVGAAAQVGGLTGAVLLGLSAARRRNVSTVLREAAGAIAAATGARYVIFGHSHAAEVVNLREKFGVGHFGETSYYLNSGSWVTREILRGEAGTGMTYVEINEAGAQLKRWRGADVVPVVLAATAGK